MFVVKGIDAIILNAEMSVPKPHEAKWSYSHPTVNWEDDTEENRNDPKIMWMTSSMDGCQKKYRFRALTPEERARITDARRIYLMRVYTYILENYDYESARAYYNRRKKEFDEVEAVPEFNIPHCEYTKDRQCDLFCYYYKEGKCIWN